MAAALPRWTAIEILCFKKGRLCVRVTNFRRSPKAWRNYTVAASPTPKISMVTGKNRKQSYKNAYFSFSWPLWRASRLLVVRTYYGHRRGWKYRHRCNPTPTMFLESSEPIWVYARFLAMLTTMQPGGWRMLGNSAVRRARGLMSLTASLHDPKLKGITYADFVTEADTNKDGKVSIKELAGWMETHMLIFLRYIRHIWIQGSPGLQKNVYW